MNRIALAVVLLVMTATIFGVTYASFLRDQVQTGFVLASEFERKQAELDIILTAKDSQGGVAGALDKIKQELQSMAFDIPSESDVSGLLQDIASGANLSSLSLTQFSEGEHVGEGQVLLVPVQVSVRGAYTNILHFVKQIEQFKRMISIDELMLETKADTQDEVVLEAKLRITSYRLAL